MRPSRGKCILLKPNFFALSQILEASFDIFTSIGKPRLLLAFCFSPCSRAAQASRRPHESAAVFSSLLASKNSAAFSIVQDRQALAAIGSVCKHVAQYLERHARRGLCKLLRLFVDKIIGRGAKRPDPFRQ